jgi:hypothetical protein
MKIRSKQANAKIRFNRINKAMYDALRTVDARRIDRLRIWLSARMRAVAKAPSNRPSRAC